MNVPGYPKPKYIWKKENTNLSPATDARYRLRDGGSLEIINVRISDQGNYTVTVQQAGYEVEVTIEVYVVGRCGLTQFLVTVVAVLFCGGENRRKIKRRIMNIKISINNIISSQNSNLYST